LLLAHKANVNLKNKSGSTPLRIALNMAKRDVAELLRQHGGTH
jgi:ankyrin repeat protein